MGSKGNPSKASFIVRLDVRPQGLLSDADGGNRTAGCLLPRRHAIVLAFQQTGPDPIVLAEQVAACSRFFILRLSHICQCGSSRDPGLAPGAREAGPLTASHICCGGKVPVRFSCSNREARHSPLVRTFFAPFSPFTCTELTSRGRSNKGRSYPSVPRDMGLRP